MSILGPQLERKGKALKPRCFQRCNHALCLAPRSDPLSSVTVIPSPLIGIWINRRNSQIRASSTIYLQISNGGNVSPPSSPIGIESKKTSNASAELKSSSETAPSSAIGPCREECTGNILLQSNWTDNDEYSELKSSERKNCLRAYV